ncbi:MAG: DUF4256 domain-containing protein [Atopobium sp.]|nr:DUF4256 domain-containing protein [Atopobium sp.]
MDLNELLALLQTRFEKHASRHPNISWELVVKAISASKDAQAALTAMESTGGEPDVIEALATSEHAIVFVDCYAKPTKDRTSLCYDHEALISRKKNPPRSSVEDAIAAWGSSARLLSEAEYYAVQQITELDTKVSCWIATPEELRSYGGALFCEKRYGRVFTFHNGADSYYGSRGYRTVLYL